MKRPKLREPGRRRSPTAQLLFATAGTAAAPVLIDCRPKTIPAARGKGAPHNRLRKHVDRSHSDGWPTARAPLLGPSANRRCARGEAGLGLSITSAEAAEKRVPPRAKATAYKTA